MFYIGIAISIVVAVLGIWLVVQTPSKPSEDIVSPEYPI